MMTIIEKSVAKSVYLFVIHSKEDFDAYEREKDNIILRAEQFIALECGDQVEVKHGNRSFEAYVVGNTIDFKKVKQTVWLNKHSCYKKG